MDATSPPQAEPGPETRIWTWTRRVGDLTYTCSTDRRLVQLDAINAAFASDMLYWARPMEPEVLRRCVQHSMCFGLYVSERGCGGGDDGGGDGGGSEGACVELDLPLSNPPEYGAPYFPLLHCPWYTTPILTSILTPSSYSLPATASTATATATAAPEMVGLARLVTDYVTFGYLTDVYVLERHQRRGLGRWMMECVDEVLASWTHLRRCLLFTSGAAAVGMYRDALGARELSETPSADLVLLQRSGPGATPGGPGR